MHRTQHLSVSIAAMSVLALASCTKSTPTPAANTPAAQPELAGKTPPRVEKLEPYACGTVERLHTWNGIFIGSQPGSDDLKHAHENGVKTILDLRPASEDRGFDEAARVSELAMEYVHMPVGSPADLTDETFERARAVLRDDSKRPVFVHCQSGNRAGAVWAAFRALDGGLSWEAALAEAKQVGLKGPALEQRAHDYVVQMKARAAH